MQNKHLQIDADNKLFAEIRLRVKQDLVLNKTTFYLVLFSKLVLFLGGAVALYASLYLIQSTFLFVIAYILLGLFLLLLAFNFAHDFSHNTVFKNKQWNNLGFIFIYSLVGAHAEAWKDRHVNSHHFAPNVKEYDSDLQIIHLIRVTPSMEFKWYHVWQYLYAPLAYATYSLYWVCIKDILILFEKLKSRDASPGYVLSFFTQKLFYFSYLLVLPILYAPQSAGLVLLGFLLMHFVQSVFLLFTFFMTHHVLETTYPSTSEDGIIQSSWFMNQIRSSNDMNPFSLTANFLLGGFNNHIAHHLFPHIHHIYYPRLNKILYRILIDNGIKPNQTTYWGGVVSHVLLLKRLSRRDAYNNGYEQKK